MGDILLDAKDKNVIVIGGGDTGCDCIGTSMRHQAKSIINLEVMGKPPSTRDKEVNAWPQYPKVYSLDYGHQEVKANFGYDPRNYNIATKEFTGDEDGNLKGLKTVQIDKNFNVIPNSERVYPADLVLLAMGFTNPESEIMTALDVEVKRQKNGNFTVDANNKDYKTNVPKVFTAGDCRRGQSLVVWAIAEGRGCADAVNAFLGQRKGPEVKPAPKPPVYSFQSRSTNGNGASGNGDGKKGGGNLLGKLGNVLGVK